MQQEYKKTTITYDARSSIEFLAFFKFSYEYL